MLPSLVPLLACPWCGGHLTLEDVRPQPPESPERPLNDASLRCGTCGRRTYVVDGIWDAMGDLRMPRTPAQITNRLRIVAAGYERFWRRRSLSLLSGRRFPVAEELAELTTSLAPVLEPGGAPRPIVVDLACSEGLYARALADCGATVLAVDHSRAFLQRVRRLAGDRPIVAVRASAQRLPLQSGTVDAIAIGASLNEIGDAPTAVAETARVARPDARLFSMSLVRAATGLGRGVQALLRPSGIDFPSLEQTQHLFETAGWAIAQPSALDRIVVRVSAVRAPRAAS